MIFNAVVVDDDRASAAAISKLLARLGCKVVVCTDAQQAVAPALADNVDLVSLDISMPALDGYEVLSLIRSHEHTRRAPSVPVIAITGKVASADRAATLAAGFAAHLGKPVMLADLERALRRVAALRGEPYRTRYSADSDAIAACVDRLLGAGQADRFEALAGVAMGVESHGRALIEQALGDAYARRVDAAARHADKLRGIGETIGAARLCASCRAFTAALTQGADAFEHQAVLTRAELDRVVYTLRERVLR